MPLMSTEALVCGKENGQIKTLIINGSPKGNAGNTVIIIKKFNEGTQGL